MTSSKHDTAAHFSRRAEAYAASPSHARGEDLEIVAGFAAPGPHDRCLDIACGPGHTALRIAREAALVIAADVAPGMLAAARRLAAERGLDNLLVLYADAAALPFAGAGFDLVTCRIAPHHFADVPGFLAEAVRVLAPAGRFVIEDSLAPDDSETAAFLEELEKRRDPTHVHSLSDAEWRAALAAAGLRVTAEKVWPKRRDFALWVGRAGLDVAEIAALEARVLGAPAALSEALFEIEAGAVRALRDCKVIFRTELSRPTTSAA
jgi:ubiquinone/menaquinone biosynthesis C-methylase UbiE